MLTFPPFELCVNKVVCHIVNRHALTNTHLKKGLGRLLLNSHNFAALPMFTAEPTTNAASTNLRMLFQEIKNEEVASSTKETTAEIESTELQEPTYVLV